MSTELKAHQYFSGDGTQTNFAFSFDYLSGKFVKVEVNDIPLTYGQDYIVTTRAVNINEPPTGTIHIYRETSTDRLVSWEDGSVFKASTMSLNQIQQLHILEELQDYVVQHGMTLDPSDNCWEAFNKRIKNVGFPVNPDDAVTVRYIEDARTNFIATVQKACNDAISLIQKLCSDTMAAIRSACDNALNAVATKETDMLTELAAIRVELADKLTQCTEKAEIAVDAAESTVATAGRIAPVLKGQRKQCWLLCKLPKTVDTFVHYKVLGAQVYDESATLEVGIQNVGGWCEYKGRSIRYPVVVRAYETEDSIDVYLFSQNYDDVWEVFLEKYTNVTEFAYKRVGDETYEPDGTLKCDTATGQGMGGVDMFCGKKRALLSSPVFTGTVTAPTLTVTTTLNIPGGSIWIT